MKERQLERGIEWEAAAEPREFQGIEVPCPPFVPGTRRFTVRRNAHLALEIEAHGTMIDAGDFARLSNAEDSVPAGTFLSDTEAEFDANGARCWVKAWFEPVPGSVTVDTNGTRFVQSASQVRFRWRWSQKFDFSGPYPTSVPIGEAGWRSDWFVNAPHVPFWRFTKRKRTSTFARTRGDTDVVACEPPSGPETRDHVVVRLDGYQFSVCKVPEEFAPSWCQPMSLDFPAPIPPDRDREAIAEILSFLFGRRFMPVGSTLFDSAGWTIEEEAMSPWGDTSPSVFRRGDLAPIPLGLRSEQGEWELGVIVAAYLRERDRLGLRDALLTYWLAVDAVAGVDIALYGSAVEALKTSWFKSTKSKSRGEYMPAAKYEELLGDLLATAGERLSAAEVPQSVANKLAGAWRMGGGEQLLAFFEEIALPIGAAEKAAIKARNGPVHGGLKAGANVRELARHGNAYRTLFERTFLTLLGYSGNYIDRTALGHPAHFIGEPCLGSAPP